MKLINFQPAHLDIAEIQDIDKKDLLSKDELNILSQHPSTTLIHDGRVIACIGCLLCKENVGTVWVIPTKYLSSNPIGFARIIKQYIETLPVTFNFKKMIADCKGNKTRQKFLKWLGFKFVEKKGDIFFYEKTILGNS